MQLTQFTDVGLRILLRLAAAEHPLTAAIVAKQMRLSYTHVTKVALRLQELGLVESKRGRGGGIAITHAGRFARVGDVARQLEGDGEVLDCEGNNPCPLHQACRLRHALRQAQTAFFDALDAYTVNDLLSNGTLTILKDLA